MNLSWLDLVIAAIIAAGAFRGFKRGLIREGMALAGLLGGLVAASRWHDLAADLLKPFIGGGQLVHGLAYLLIVLAALVCATLLTVLMRRLMRPSWVRPMERAGGILVGAAQGAVVVILVLFLMVKYPVLGIDRAVKSSETGWRLLGLLSPAVASLPPELAPVAGFFELPAK